MPGNKWMITTTSLITSTEHLQSVFRSMADNNDLFRNIDYGGIKFDASIMDIAESIKPSLLWFQSKQNDISSFLYVSCGLHDVMDEDGFLIGTREQDTIKDILSAMNVIADGAIMLANALLEVRIMCPHVRISVQIGPDASSLNNPVLYNDYAGVALFNLLKKIDSDPGILVSILDPWTYTPATFRNQHMNPDNTDNKPPMSSQRHWMESKSNMIMAMQRLSDQVYIASCLLWTEEATSHTWPSTETDCKHISLLGD